MKFILKSVKEKKFKTTEGQETLYYWYTGKRSDNGTMARIGSTGGDLELDKELDLDVSEEQGQFGNYFKVWR